MLIFRYLAKEVMITLTALTAILLLIFMSNQLVQYLNRAVAGSIPGMIIMKLMMLELPNLIGLLLPLGFYIALLVAYGRLYTDNEMIVLQACGYGPKSLFKHSFILALTVSFIALLIMVWVSPMIATERAKLMRTTGLKTLIQTLTPGQFRQTPKGNEIFYVESMDNHHAKAKHVFLARQVNKKEGPQWDIVWAQQASVATDPTTQLDYIRLESGHVYEGFPGRADYQVAQFKEYKSRLPMPVVTKLQDDVRTASTWRLLTVSPRSLAISAELQWRFSMPIMVLVLTLVAVPLSRVNPRAGKYGKLLPAILIYILYANFMFVSRNWIMQGKIPLWIGMNWLHLSIALLGLIFIWRTRSQVT